MKLIKIEECELHTDSFTGKRFGESDQLQVIGWSGKRGANKLYILKCDVCREDSELFGQGYFTCSKGHLTDGRIPCGCSKNPKWTKEQYQVLCSRKAEEMGYEFLGFEGIWKGKDTNIKLLCKKHGEWASGTIASMINAGHGCPICARDILSLANSIKKKKPDEVMIASFFASGAFHPDTKFWRSGQLNGEGTKIYWFMGCPECEEIGEALSGNLQKGARPCACSPMRQQECYINYVVNHEGIAVALKFGVATNSQRRMKTQNRHSKYKVTQAYVYKFPTVSDCKRAEKDCKQELQCGILSKQEMPDGYTETTDIGNLIKIVEIYERNGGILNE